MTENRPAGAISQFTEFAHAAGHENHGQVDGFLDIHGRETFAQHFKSNIGASYIAQIAPGADYGLITAHYNVFADILGELSESELEELANSEEGYKEHEDEDVHRVGARALLLRCDEEQLEAARDDVIDALESPDIVYSIRTTERKSYPYHFFVYKRVFPYYDSFTPDRFNDAVQTVTHYKQQAMSAYHGNVELPFEEETPQQTARAEPTTAGIGRDQPYQ